MVSMFYAANSSMYNFLATSLDVMPKTVIVALPGTHIG